MRIKADIMTPAKTSVYQFTLRTRGSGGSSGGSSGGLGPGRRPSSLFPPAAALVPASRLPRLRSPGRELLSSLSSLQQQDPARGPQRRHHGEGGWTRQV